jgi:hypothetical protein
MTIGGPLNNLCAMKLGTEQIIDGIKKLCKEMEMSDMKDIR